MDNIPYKVFAANLKSRKERKIHIQTEFNGRDEFCFTLFLLKNIKKGLLVYGKPFNIFSQIWFQKRKNSLFVKMFFL